MRHNKARRSIALRVKTCLRIKHPSGLNSWHNSIAWSATMAMGNMSCRDKTVLIYQHTYLQFSEGFKADRGCYLCPNIRAHWTRMPQHPQHKSNQITNHTAIHRATLSSHHKHKHKPTPRPRQANLSMHIAHLITRPSHGVQSALSLTSTKSRNKGMKHPPTTRTLTKPKPYPHNNIYLVLTIHKRNAGSQTGPHSDRSKRLCCSSNATLESGP